MKKETTDKNPVSPSWNTIHIFGYGESQIIGAGTNGKAPNTQVNAITNVLSFIGKSIESAQPLTLQDTSAINIFNGAFIDFIPRSKKYTHKRFAWKDIDATIIDTLADEIGTKMVKNKYFDDNNLPIRKIA